MPDLSSVVPVPRFAATMGYYLIKIRNPRENYIGKIFRPESSIGTHGRASLLGFATCKRRCSAEKVFF